MSKEKIFLSVIFFVIFQTSCSRAETLSELDPPKFELKGVIDWKNGIANLVQERCASCHAKVLGRFVPETTPLLDFTVESEFLSVRQRSLQRIQDERNPMPPLYADPLFEDERQLLIEFLKKS